MTARVRRIRAGLIVMIAATAFGALSAPAEAGNTAAPTVTKVAPSYGPVAGGTHVTVTGTGFDNVQAVRFGGVDATFQAVSPTKLTATTPAHAAGLVSVAVVTSGGSGLDKAAFRYAKPAPRPVGAGYLVPHAYAKTGSMRVVVPKLICRAHENAAIAAVLQDVQKLRAGDGWAGSVSLKCVDGRAQYGTYMRCAGQSKAFKLASVHPGAVVTISYYNADSVQVAVTDGNQGTAAACPSGPDPQPYANQPAIAFLVTSASKPPAALSSLAVRGTAAHGKLSVAHPHAQKQRLSATKQLVPEPIASDGKTFTVRLQRS